MNWYKTALFAVIATFFCVISYRFGGFEFLAVEVAVFGVLAYFNRRIFRRPFMQCPNCKSDNTNVKQPEPSEDNCVVTCEDCGHVTKEAMELVQ